MIFNSLKASDAITIIHKIPFTIGASGGYINHNMPIDGVDAQFKDVNELFSKSIKILVKTKKAQNYL